MIIVRVAPAPSMTTVCMGMSTGAGMNSAIVASKSTPPAAPAKTPKKAAANEAIDRPRKSSVPTLGALRKCMFVLIFDVLRRSAAGLFNNSVWGALAGLQKGAWTLNPSGQWCQHQSLHPKSAMGI
ncbi:MAG: hypothetical protein ACRECE_09040 [Xanthobacteraceae bacterium]